MIDERRENVTATADLATSPTNRAHRAAAEAALRELLRLATRRGFFGSVGLEIVVQDGTIQHLRRRLEQMQK